MAKDILLYGGINEYTSAEFIRQIDEHEGENLVVRINSKGGSPEYGWGMAAKYAEFEGSKTAKVDGAALSTALFFICYADQVEALDVSEFGVHRAAYPDWFEKSDEYFTEALRENLDRVNKSLRAAFEAKVDVAKFEELKGVKIKDLFSMDGRKDVILSAKEAKQIGLINKVVKITPAKKAEISANFDKISYKFGVKEDIAPLASQENGVNEPEKTKKMNIEELKAKHPEAFQAAFNAGVEAEQDRTGAWLVYADANMTAVKSGIESGKGMSAKDAAELNRAAAGLAAVATIEANSQKAVETEKEKTEEESLEESKTAFMGAVLTAAKKS